METKKLAIQGKVIVFNDIQNKSLAQFKQQLKQNGIVLEDEQVAKHIYYLLRKEKTEKQHEEKKGE